MVKRMQTIAIALTLLVLSVQGVWAKSQYKIAIFQHQEFQPFQKAHDGFLDGLAALGYKDRITLFEDFNAKSDLKALEAHIKAVCLRPDIDLVLAIGTHSATRLVKATDRIPIVFTIVGDPENAGLVTNWKSSGRNYTGVETPNYYSKLVRLMRHFVPFKRLGMVYLKGSPSHEAGIKQIAALAQELNFKFVSRGFALRNKQKKPFPEPVLRQNLERSLAAVCPQVDAFFVQTSNAFTTEFDLFLAAFLKYRLISAGDPTNIHKGLVMGIGKDAHHFGEQAAKYAIQILEGAAPSALPMDVGKKLNIELNLKAAELIGFKPPFELLSGADIVYRTIQGKGSPQAN
jgi:putative tryptophan/tyrosine transport system substrate-binding protein